MFKFGDVLSNGATVIESRQHGSFTHLQVVLAWYPAKAEYAVWVYVDSTGGCDCGYYFNSIEGAANCFADKTRSERQVATLRHIP